MRAVDPHVPLPEPKRCQDERGWCCERRLPSKALTPDDATEAELKKRTLTNLYNQRPSWLQMAHDQLDRAVWHAYGWEDDPTRTTEDDILTRLLTLNRARSATP